ncbi:helicase-associated domain-containing protein [Catellatospora tritici]|uniref:helicase-associated domain-containing protein n=1 Tax=Catellatospora tritici TaxID=2851566 RepID=UPI001C2D28CD|nr:helicase-associated domain-containing protein [Catellatospora tritici]MBV1851858.1 helicase C-terminal domain-containing protein [Catellatospora tritici]
MTTEYADHLRTLSDDALGALLRLRPDLITPVPTDVTVLAARAQTRVSVARTLDTLDRFTLEILDALRLTRDPDGHTTSLASVVAMACAPTGGPEPARVAEAVGRLQARALVYGPDDALRLIPTVDEVCSPYLAGLGRPAAELDTTTESGGAVTALVADPAKLRRTLLSAPPNARAVLDRLAEGPPVGTSTNRSEPVAWLLEHHLLVATGDDAVELPRELGLLLRRDAGPLGQLHPEPPEVTGPPRPVLNADRAGAGQAMSAVRHTEDLLEALHDEPAPVLRGGGLGVLPLRRLAKSAGIAEPLAALLLETAMAAGLLGELELGSETVFLPAAGYDLWRGTPLAQRWAVLAGAWLAMPRQPGLAGGRDEKDRPLTALSPQLERAGMPAARRAVLAELAQLPPGAAPSPDELLERLRWQAPRRLRGRAELHREALSEAAELGVTGSGALTGYGRLLLDVGHGDADGDPLGLRPEAELPPEQTPLVVALAALLPPPVDHVLVQADLTVVVPGPPESALAAELDLVAEHESGGGASVYRVTAASLRRALDAGYAGTDLHALFQRRSRTAVPQALTYLIDDVSRTHGGLRTGAAQAYLRSDDEGLVSAVLADRRLSALQLRRLAPTVLISPFSSGRLLTALRDAGYAPVPEDATGAAVLTRPKSRRAAPRAALEPQPDPLEAPGLTEPRLLGIVEEIRRGEARARAARRAPAEVRAAAGYPMSSLTAVQAHSQALAVLQQAVRDKAKVWVGYVDAHGANASRLVRPVSLGAGYLRAEDDRTQTLHTFALHRITAAAPAD